MDKWTGAFEGQCTGCAACANICKMNAIEMVRDEKGFVYPYVNKDICIDCGACVKVCKACRERAEHSSVCRTVYAMRSRNEEVRLRSTSGGIFSELACCILERKGGICGAVYRDDWSVGHDIIWNSGDLEKVRRSKYQQSNIELQFRKVKEALDERKEILFCGTPCQAAGLKAFLGKDYDNLFVCDFICRGVSSPKIFAKYIEDLRNRFASDIKYVWMKNKCNGWHSLTTVIGFENGAEYRREGMNDSYVRLYLKYNVGVRESCYACGFKGNKSAADITLGDFWGLDNTELDDNKGTSAVICRTEKGTGLLAEISGNVVGQKMRLGDIQKGNPCLDNSLGKGDTDMKKFYDVLEKEGYQQALKWIAVNADEQ